MITDWKDKGVQEVRSTIQFLTKGCSCKKACTSNDCRSKNKLLYCGPGCECQGCLYVYLPEQQNIKHSSSDDDRVDDYSESSESVI